MCVFCAQLIALSEEPHAATELVCEKAHDASFNGEHTHLQHSILRYSQPFLVPQVINLAKHGCMCVELGLVLRSDAMEGLLKLLKLFLRRLRCASEPVSDCSLTRARSTSRCRHTMTSDLVLLSAVLKFDIRPTG